MTTARVSPSVVIAAVLALAACAWAVYFHATVDVLPYDDGYVTFRYVENCIRGEGLVYNAGQRVFGSTTPLYTLLLVFVRLFVETPTPEVAVRFNLVPFLACGVAVGLLVHRYLRQPALGLLATAVFLVDPLLLSRSAGGMESFVFLACVLFALWTLCEPTRPILTGVLIGLAMLTRPEGVLVIPIALWAFRRDRKAIVRGVAATIVVALPWVVFATAYYGTPIPLSVIAKAKRVYPIDAGEGVKTLLEWTDFWITAARGEALGSLRVLLVLGTLALATFATVRSQDLRQRGAWMPAALFWLMVAFYAAANPFVFEWYAPLFWVPALLALVVGVPALGHMLARVLTNRQRPRAASASLPAMLAVTAAWMIVACHQRYHWVASRSPKPLLEAPFVLVRNDPTRLRVLAYRAIAERTNQYTNERTVIAAPEIGAFGYYSHARILDSCGLVSPEAHPFLPIPADQRAGPGIGAVGRDLVRTLAPDYVVSMRVFAVNSLLVVRDGNLQLIDDTYEVIDQLQLPAPIWGDDLILVFRRAQR